MNRYGYRGDFLAVAENIGANTTIENGTDFTSIGMSLPYDVLSAMLLLTFTRAAGSASLTLDFYFQVSADNGATWNDYVEGISIETGHAVVSGNIVRIARQLNLGGITHIRLSKVVNNDTVNDLTAVNATICF